MQKDNFQEGTTLQPAMKLSVKLPLIITAVGIVGAVITGVLTFNNAQQLITQQAEQTLSLRAEAYQNQMSQKLNEHQVLLGQSLKQKALLKAVSDLLSSYPQIKRATSQKNKTNTHKKTPLPTLQSLNSYRYKQAFQNMTTSVAPLLKETGKTSVWLLSPTGELIYHSSSLEHLSKQFKLEDKLTHAKPDERKQGVTAVSLSHKEGDDTKLLLGYPLVSSEGKLLGYLGFAPLEKTSNTKTVRLLKNPVKPTNDKVIIPTPLAVTSKQVLPKANKQELTSKRTSFKTEAKPKATVKKVMAIDGAKEAKSPSTYFVSLLDGMVFSSETQEAGFDMKKLSDLVQRNEKESGFFTLPSESGEFYGVYTRELVAGQTLTSVVLEDRAALFAPLTKLQSSLLAQLFIVAIALSLAGFLLSRVIVGPLEQLTEALRTVEETGNFDLELDYDSNDEIGQATYAVTELLSRLRATFLSVSDSLNAMAKGDFSQKVTLNLKGDLNTLQTGVNRSIIQVEDTTQQLSYALKAIANGDFSYRPCLATAEGEYRNLLVLCDSSLEGLQTNIQQITKTLEAMAEGDFNQQVSSSAKGDLLALTRNINATRLSLNELVQEVADVMEALSKGDLSQGIKNPAKGDLAKLKQSINTTINDWRLMVQELDQSAFKVIDSSSKLKSISSESLTKSELVKVLSSRGYDVALTITGDETRELPGSLNEVKTSASQVEYFLKQVDQTTHQVAERVIHGTRELEQSVAAITSLSNMMDKLASTVLENANSVQQLVDFNQQLQREGEQTKKTIATLSATIADIDISRNEISTIAEQTNMLAINALIEAATTENTASTEGFNVVANEVKQLSLHVGNASSDIQTKLELVKDDLARVVQAIQSMDSLVSNNMALQQEAAMLIQNQTGAVQEVNLELHAIKNDSSNLSRRLKLDADSLKDLSSKMEQTTESLSHVTSCVDEVLSETEVLKQALLETQQSAETTLAIAQTTESYSDDFRQVADGLKARVSQFIK